MMALSPTDKTLLRLSTGETENSDDGTLGF
jgi:hypothetical protein